MTRIIQNPIATALLRLLVSVSAWVAVKYLTARVAARRAKDSVVARLDTGFAMKLLYRHLFLVATSASSLADRVSPCWCEHLCR